VEAVLAKASEYRELVDELRNCLPVRIWLCVVKALERRDIYLFLTDSKCNEKSQSEDIERRKQASLKELAEIIRNTGSLSLRDASMLFQDMDEIYSYMDMLEKGLIKLMRTVSDPRDVHECRQRCREEHRNVNQWLVNIANLLLGSAISGILWLISGNLAFSPLVVFVVTICFAASLVLLYKHKKTEREVEERKKICLERCDQQDIYRQEMRRFEEYLNKLREKAMNIQWFCVTRSSSSAMAE
jgi:uncharacterized membrane protein